MTKIITELAMSFIGSTGFAFIFNSKHRHLFFLGMGGFLSWSGYIISHLFIKSIPLCYFIAAVVATLYSEILARIFKTPTTTILIPALIPSVPGSMLYYTMLYLVKSEWKNFFNEGTATLKVAVSIALGVVVVSIVIKSVVYFGNQLKHHHS